jgi:hypothetical protein
MRAYPGMGSAVEGEGLSAEAIERLESLDSTAATQELLRLREQLLRGEEPPPAKP